MSSKIFYLEIVMSMSHRDKDSNKTMAKNLFQSIFHELTPQPTKMTGNDRKRPKWTKWIVPGQA